ncbi:hypothetical protein I4U23_027905 [Adineta vaga]|nr:hypothetical protein I4U23_027905 [Adineta vaga]
MANHTEIDTFLDEKKQIISSKPRKYHAKWWYQEYNSQEIISNIIESYNFRAVVIFLVVIDTSLVVTEILLDSFKIHYECEHYDQHPLNLRNKIKKERVEYAMEIVHFTSIIILSFFFIELIIRIYACGREFWNIRRRKMEYFDAFIVIVSLIIDLWLLHGEKILLGEQLILILALRLWRFVRIISSVAESIRHGQRKHKERLNHQYLFAVRRLIELLLYKTTYAEKNQDKDFDSLLEQFRMVDEQCKSSLEALDQNQELTSSRVVAQFVEQIQGIENKNNPSVISAMFTKEPQL